MTGYYLAENGKPFVWGEILQAVAKEANKQGLLPSPDVKSLAFEEAKELLGVRFAVSTGTHSQGQALRGKTLLGWKPQERELLDEIPTVVDSEARLLGFIKSHAQEAAGQ